MSSLKVKTIKILSMGIVLALLFGLLVPSLGLAKGAAKGGTKSKAKSVAKAEVKDDWSMYQHDAKHSGRSDYEGPNSPAVQWVVPFGATGKPTTPIIVSASGKLFVGVDVTPANESTTTTTTTKQESSGHSGIFAFGPDTKVLWVSKVNGKVSGPPAIGKDGTVYAVIGTELAALKEKDGSAKWKMPLNSESTSGITLGADGTIYVATSAGATVYAVSSDGKIKWTYAAGAPIENPIAIGSDGTVYFTAKDMSLYAVGTNGALKWKYKVTEEGTDQLSAPAIGQDDTVYFGGNKNQGYLTDADGTLKGIFREYLYAVNPDGSLKWRTQAKGKTVNTPAIAKDGTIIFGTTTINYTVGRDYTFADCYVQAVGPDSKLKWAYRSSDNAIDGPAIIGQDGTLYVSSTEGMMTCLTGNQGVLLWRAKTGGKASIGPKGTIYVAAKSSIAAIIDKNQKIAREKKKVEDIANKDSSSGSLSFLIYILPILIALGIGYFFKARVNKGADEEQED